VADRLASEMPVPILNAARHSLRKPNFSKSLSLASFCYFVHESRETKAFRDRKNGGNRAERPAAD